MKSLIVVVLVLLSGGPLSAQFFSEETREARLWTIPLSRSFKDADYAPLRSELKRRRPEMAVAEAQWLLERNVRFVIENRLNRNRMLVAPRAQDVIDRMARLLGLTHEIFEKVATGRKMAVEHRLGERPALPLDLVRDVGALADQIRSDFGNSFVELRENRVAIGVAGPIAPYSCFVYFLLEAERLQRRLESALQGYFLAPEPGTVTTEDFSRGSVMALSKGLEWLSDQTYKNLKEKH